MEDKSEVMSMSPRTGRPTDNPKNHKVTVRLDDEAASILEKYCKQENIERREAARRGINKLKSDIKNRSNRYPTKTDNCSKLS